MRFKSGYTKLFLLFCSLATISTNAETVSLYGTVLKPDGTPLKKCIVSLRKLKMKDTTDSDGNYSFNSTTNAAVLKDNAPQKQSGVSFTSTKLSYTISHSGSLCLSLLDLKGQKLHSWKSGTLSGGSHIFPLSEVIPNSFGKGMYIIQLQTNHELQTFQCLKTGNGVRIIPKSGDVSTFRELDGALSKTTATVDTIDFKATDYISKSFTISSYVMHCKDVTLEKKVTEPQPIDLTSSMLKGKWCCIFYNQDGCEDYITINNYSISNMTIVPSSDGVQFSGTWGTYQLAGGIIDQTNLLIILSRSDAVFNYQDIRLIALTQSHPDDVLAGSVFSGICVMGQFNATTGLELCQGTSEFIMVRDFTDIGGTSTSSGSTYNPSKSGFESNQSECLTDYIECSQNCSRIYGPDEMNRYSTCIAKCNDEENNCKEGK